MAEPAAERPTTGISPSIVALAPFAVVGWRSVVDARSTAGRADDAAGAGKRYLLLGRLVV